MPMAAATAAATPDATAVVPWSVYIAIRPGAGSSMVTVSVPVSSVSPESVCVNEPSRGGVREKIQHTYGDVRVCTYNKNNTGCMVRLDTRDT